MSYGATDHSPVWYWNPMEGRKEDVGLPLSLFAETWTTLEFKPETGVGKLQISNTVRSKTGAFPEGFEPECFYYNAILKQNVNYVRISMKCPAAPCMCRTR